MKKNIKKDSIINESLYLCKVQTFFLKQYLVLLILMFSINVKSQLIDSIQLNLQYEPKLLVKLDTRNSFITSTYSKVRGVKVGVHYNNTFRVGLGYNWMSNDFIVTPIVDSLNLRLNYISAFIEYAFYSTKHWQFEIPVQFGIGTIRYKDLQKNTIKLQWVPIWEPAMTFEYKFLNYFGIGIGAGYRLVIKDNKTIKERFTAPIYILRFKVRFGDMYSDYLKK